MNKIEQERLKADLMDAMQALMEAQSMVRTAIWQLEELSKKTDEKTE